MSLAECKIQWGAGAVLQELVPSTRAVAWVGDQFFNGTVEGAIRLFRSLPRERQQRVDMFVDVGVVDGTSKTILGFDELCEIANRPDVPEA